MNQTQVKTLQKDSIILYRLHKGVHCHIFDLIYILTKSLEIEQLKINKSFYWEYGPEHVVSSWWRN
jgi:hypothetical protein